MFCVIAMTVDSICLVLFCFFFFKQKTAYEMRISDWSDVCSSDLLIERGYIYIGLPPLYKIKQGKSEIYLKDDAALNVYLANNAVEGASLIPAESEPAIEGAALKKLLLAYAGARDTTARNAHRKIGRAQA